MAFAIVQETLEDIRTYQTIQKQIIESPTKNLKIHKNPRGCVGVLLCVICCVLCVVVVAAVAVAVAVAVVVVCCLLLVACCLDLL